MLRRFEDFFLALSCADERVFERMIEERGRSAARRRMVALGMVVFVPAIWAVLSMFILLYFLANFPVAAALVVSLVWSAMVLAMDIAITMSLRRQEKPWQTVGMAVPRILTALVIGMCITEPLVMMVFSDTIDPVARSNKIEEQRVQRDKIDAERGKVDELQKDLTTVVARLEGGGSAAALSASRTYQNALASQRAAEKKAAAARKRALCELDGTCGSSEDGAGPIYQAKRQSAESLERDARNKRAYVESVKTRVLDHYRTQLSTERPQLLKTKSDLESRIAGKRNATDADSAEIANAFSGKIGFLDRAEALHQLIFQNLVVFISYFVILLALVGLDTAAVWSKLWMVLGKKSDYERVADTVEDADALGAEAHRDALREVARIEAQSSVDAAKAWRKAQGRVNEQIAAQAAEIALEVGLKTVESLRPALEAEASRQVGAINRAAGAPGAPMATRGNASNRSEAENE